MKLTALSINLPLEETGETVKQSLSKEAIRKIKYKQMVWKTYRSTGSEEDYAIYEEALNQATAGIRNSKRSCEQKFAFNIKHVFMDMFKETESS